MSDRKLEILTILEATPPHYWPHCDLTADDVPAMRCIIQEDEHTWSDLERIEVEMLINRLNDEWREDNETL